MMHRVDIYTVIGLAGFAGYVVSYALLQLEMLDGNSVRYTLANIAAAAMVLFSLLDQFNLASALIQVSWIAFGLIGLGLRLMNARSEAAPAGHQDVERPHVVHHLDHQPSPAPATRRLTLVVDNLPGAARRQASSAELAMTRQLADLDSA